MPLQQCYTTECTTPAAVMHAQEYVYSHCEKGTIMEAHLVTSNSIGSSHPIRTSKNFNSKTKFNKPIPLRQLMSHQAIHTRSQLKN